VHSIGCIYNDLKLDNICVGYPDESELDVLKLIDFGLATSYVLKENLFKEPLEDKYHIKETT
jgi:serine/threonine protein kinase